MANETLEKERRLTSMKDLAAIHMLRFRDKLARMERSSLAGYLFHLNLDGGSAGRYDVRNLCKSMASDCASGSSESNQEWLRMIRRISK